MFGFVILLPAEQQVAIGAAILSSDYETRRHGVILLSGLNFDTPFRKMLNDTFKFLEIISWRSWVVSKLGFRFIPFTKMQLLNFEERTG